LRFSFFDFSLLNLARDMRRIPLIEATMAGWARLNAAQRQRFFEAFLAAALRLDRLELRAWLLRRLRNPPLAPPIDPTRWFGDADIAAAIQRAAGKAPEPDRDEANGNPQANAPARI
jgi:hypothetical protein